MSDPRTYYSPSPEQLQKLCRIEELRERIYSIEINPDLFTSAELFREYNELKAEIKEL